MFDAFGVLLDASGAFPDAKRLLQHLNKIGKSYFVVTNGSKFPAQVSAERYRQHGLEVSNDRVISSGSLIAMWLESQHLSGHPCFVFGPESSKQLVRDAGGIVVDGRCEDFSCFILCDQSEMDLSTAIDDAISSLYRLFERNTPPRLLLPNPDLIYPKGQSKFGITSGSIALVIEAALGLRYRNDPLARFERLGKPFSPIFQRALALSGTMNMAMIGDQLDTDVVGANRFGIDSILVPSGIATLAQSPQENPLAIPRFILKGLALS